MDQFAGTADMSVVVRNVMRGAITALILAIGWFATGTAATILPLQDAHISAYTYDSHASTARSARVVYERGPPTIAYDDPVAPSAVERRPHGGLARAQPGSTGTYTTYDDLVRFVQSDSGSSTTLTASGGRVADARAVEGARCAANAGERSVAIGEDMTNRVEPFAKRIGADTYKADPSAPRERWMENNRAWIRKQMEDGCIVYDCGPAPGRANFPGPTSPYYKMELEELRDYPNYIRVWLGGE